MVWSRVVRHLGSQETLVSYNDPLVQKRHIFICAGVCGALWGRELVYITQ